MGWFWGSSESNGDQNSRKDPLRDLDPNLREFLKKESPIKYNTSNDPSPRPAAPAAEKPPVHAPSSTEDSKPKVPPQSLYQDGRYAHLWKTYLPLKEVEESYKTDQERIADIVDGYKFRRTQIGSAAVENCVFEQLEANDCLKNGPWSSKMTMCREEHRKFDRCYTMQTKFLKALGYLSTNDRSPQVDEDIQMHADTLYRRMIEQEAAIATAKAEGKPEPTFPSLLASKGKYIKKEGKLRLTDLKPDVQEKFNKRLEGLDATARALEEEAIQAELSAGEQVAGRLKQIYETQDEERKTRKDEGKSTFGDKVTSILRVR